MTSIKRVATLAVAVVGFAAAGLEPATAAQPEPKGKQTFQGMIYVKHGRLGTKSEGPDYFLQTYNRDYKLRYKDRTLFQPDFELEFYNRKMVEVIGALDGDTIRVSHLFQINVPHIPRPKNSSTKGADSGGSNGVNVAAGNNAFAFDLYRHLSRKAEKNANLVFSPYSISTALAMTYAGARDSTAAEMAKTLRFAPDQAEFHPACARLIQQLEAPGIPRKYSLTVANALWAQQNYKFLPPFLKLVQESYDAPLHEVDFAGRTEDARKTINAWVEDRTNQKIQELLKPGVLNSLTRLVLTNAIYFKANWLRPFEKEATTLAPFQLATNKTVKVPLMQQRETFRHYGNEDLQILEMPYEKAELSMVVVLPAKVDGLAALEKTLTAPQLEKWLSQAKPRWVDVGLPKFKVFGEFKLNETLVDMGMPSAFEAGKADFSGMSGNKRLYITAVIHKAYMDVHESGTEAAAATAVVVGEKGIFKAEATFRADHPFFYLIRHRETGAVLFMGRVTNPEAGNP